MIFSEAINKEINIRGRFAMLSCDIEFSLLFIIGFAEAYENTTEIKRNLKGMTFNEKINNAKSVLKEFKPHLYTEYKDQLDKLDEFRIIRNHMSHFKGSFPNESDLSIFRVEFIEIHEKKQGIRFIDIPMDYIEGALERFIKLNCELVDLYKMMLDESILRNKP